MPVGVVIIYTFIFICLWTLHNKIPESGFLLGSFFLYLPCAWVIMTLHHHYICVQFNIVNMIYVSSVICLCILNYLLFCCTSSFEVYSISLLCTGYYTTKLLVHLNFIYMFVHIISIFTVILLHTLYYILLDCI